MVVDNYTKHDNRKIWILWDDKNKGDLFGLLSPILTQKIKVTGTHETCCTTIYALNTLEQRRGLWSDIEKIHQGISGP